VQGTQLIASKILYPLVLAAILAAPTAGAYTLEEFQFDDPAQAAEFRGLIEELRCLVCQNESLAGSQADLAQDLREEVYRLMRAGKTRDEIVEFLVSRYGDFVLYDPPLKLSTYPLWFGPLILAGIGALFLWRTLRAKKRAEDRELSEAERERLQRLLDRDAQDQRP
jgi:cytochrome c-type biogenesis protein CcmH